MSDPRRARPTRTATRRRRESPQTTPPPRATAARSAPEAIADTRAALHRTWSESLELVAVTGPEFWGRQAPTASEDDCDLFWARARGALDLHRACLERGVRSSVVAAATRRAGAALITPHLPSVTAWRRAFNDGASFATIARAFDVDPALVEVTLCGWPRRRRWSIEQMHAAVRAWQDGRSVDEVAAELDLTRERLLLLRRHGAIHLTPERLGASACARRVGLELARWRPEHWWIPAPDGRDPTAWWWPATVDAWLTDPDRPRCPHCGRPCANQRGLHFHISLLHHRRD